MHTTILSQMGQLCGEGVDFHPWGSKIKSHK
jgi:hypothetical protein